jgi:hypothetical protein
VPRRLRSRKDGGRRRWDDRPGTQDGGLLRGGDAGGVSRARPATRFSRRTAPRGKASRLRPDRDTDHARHDLATQCRAGGIPHGLHESHRQEGVPRRGWESFLTRASGAKSNPNWFSQAIFSPAGKACFFCRMKTQMNARHCWPPFPGDPIISPPEKTLAFLASLHPHQTQIPNPDPDPATREKGSGEGPAPLQSAREPEFWLPYAAAEQVPRPRLHTQAVSCIAPARPRNEVTLLLFFLSLECFVFAAFRRTKSLACSTPSWTP